MEVVLVIAVIMGATLASPPQSHPFEKDRPLYKDRVHKDLPLYQDRVHKDLPLYQDRVQKDLPLYQDRVHKDLPLYHDRVHKDLPLYQDRVHKDLPLYQDRVHKDLPLYQDRVHKDLPLYQDRVHKDLPLYQDRVHKDLPLYQDRVHKDLPLYKDDLVDENRLDNHVSPRDNPMPDYDGSRSDKSDGVRGQAISGSSQKGGRDQPRGVVESKLHAFPGQGLPGGDRDFGKRLGDVLSQRLDEIIPVVIDEVDKGLPLVPVGPSDATTYPVRERGHSRPLEIVVKKQTAGISTPKLSRSHYSDGREATPYGSSYSNESQEKTHGSFSSNKSQEKPYGSSYSNKSQEKPFGSFYSNKSQEKPYGSFYSNKSQEKPYGSFYSNKSQEKPHGSSSSNKSKEKPYGSFYSNKSQEKPHGSFYSNISQEKTHGSSYGDESQEKPHGSSYGDKRREKSYGDESQKKTYGSFYSKEAKPYGSNNARSRDKLLRSSEIGQSQGRPFGSLNTDRTHENPLRSSQARSRGKPFEPSHSGKIQETTHETSRAGRSRDKSFGSSYADTLQMSTVGKEKAKDEGRLQLETGLKKLLQRYSAVLAGTTESQEESKWVEKKWKSFGEFTEGRNGPAESFRPGDNDLDSERTGQQYTPKKMIKTDDEDSYDSESEIVFGGYVVEKGDHFDTEGKVKDDLDVEGVKVVDKGKTGRAFGQTPLEREVARQPVENFTCPTGYYLTGVQSWMVPDLVFSTRRFHFSCAPLPSAMDMTITCEWKGAGGVLEPTNFNCGQQAIICGWRVTWDDVVFDYVMQYQCCQARNDDGERAYHLTDCQLSGYVNQAHQTFNFTVPNGTVLYGVYTTFLDWKLDRRFLFEYCQPFYGPPDYKTRKQGFLGTGWK